MWAEPVAAILLLFSIAPGIQTQDSEGLCDYFTAIPRLPTPEREEPDYSDTTWATQPLLPPPPREDICFDAYEQGAVFGTQKIHIEEEIEGEVIIAKLNYYGEQEPYIGQFLTGQRNLLQAQLRRLPLQDNHWYLIITARQDYETPAMQRYMFEIGLEDQTLTARVSLEVVNIDDNAPVIHVLDPCTVPELGDIPRLTECVYEVTDADGEISTRFMTFNIDSDRDDEDIFSISAENVPNNWYRMTMTLQLDSMLDFETNALHIFYVTATDSLPNHHTVSLMVQVQNVESRPPRWSEIWAVQQFDEKTNQSFTVRAIDGDTGIDKPIYYKLEKQDNYTFFDIQTLEDGRGGALFTVSPIDRDTLQQEVFQLSIIAYKFDNESFATEAPIVIIVNDVNDQFPQPLHSEYSISIMEETPMTLSFEQEFGFYDRDLGEHAQYEVFLESVQPPGAAAAFYVAPQVGYQRQTFTMGTTNHSMLDYEVPEFQHIEITVVARDLHTPSLVGRSTVFINLINWNDELPIFDQLSYLVNLDETVGHGHSVAAIMAHDRDINDTVTHTLMGNANQYLTIDQLSGQILVSTDNAFDYHRQNELFVQIRADDTLGEPFHTSTTQLVIQLNDINNTPPTLRLPRGSPRVQENVPEGYEVTREITATDPDTSAYLQFEIDWTTSYATKQGRETPAVEFHNCVKIETLFPDPQRHGSALGLIRVQQIRPGVTIDFEEFEVLYLSVRVKDLNTTIGDNFDELTFTIIIVDMNDNPPVWVEGTLEQEFRVREVSQSGVVVGSVFATDIDGPLYNQIRYSLTPINDTPNNLIKIDRLTGQMSVDTTGAIDADVPPRYNLYYTVVASDKCDIVPATDCPPDPQYWDTPGNITIQITDVNNKMPQPQLDQFRVTVQIYENATSGDDVETVVARDLDRDDIYHKVSYQINYAVNTRLRDFFAIDLDTGRLHVEYTTDEVLDRDGNEPEHRIFLTLFDNFLSGGDGTRNQVDLEMLVVLLDVNDNAPILPPPNQLTWSQSENLEAGIRSLPAIFAPDRDEPGTDNSRVAYEIISITALDRDITPPELFVMITVENTNNINNTGELETATALRGYWGTYGIHVRAFDHGNPQMSTNESYLMSIRPYNYHAPEFLFPSQGMVLRLARESITINGLLTLVNGDTLERVAATDEDGLHAGTVTFDISGDDEAGSYFSVLNEGGNRGSLVLTQLLPPSEFKEFTVTLRATDGGTEPGPLFSVTTFQVVFVPTTGDPVFTTPAASVAFFESEGGLDERFQLPLAVDYKNVMCTNTTCHDIFYRIVTDTTQSFAVEPTTNIIYLTQPLNRSQSDSHIVMVAASNSPTPPDTQPTSVLAVNVIVREANPRPIFVSRIYSAGISTMDSINKQLLQVRATHSEGLPITYFIDQESMRVDPSLEAVQSSAFVLNSETGVLVLNIQPTASMHGIFEFEIDAIDETGASDQTEVKIYLISSNNRVYFLFQNTLEQVEEHKDFIVQTFSVGFGMQCNIDQILPATNTAGVALPTTTEVRAHFIQDNMPLEAETIEELRSDTLLLQNIQQTLNLELLILNDLVTGSSPLVRIDSATILIYVLGALSAVLAFICLVLLLSFIVRTRALNRRLDALSTTKFGSMDSGLNRAGVTVPGTNKHAVEGSNPIWNERLNAPDFDAISEGSDNSDLIGIEDMPQFKYYGDKSDNHEVDSSSEHYKEVPNHSNDFGFNNVSFNQRYQ